MSENSIDPHETADAPEELSDAEKSALVASTRRFDLRRIMGGLFLVYGVIVTIIGLVNNTSDMKKTGGIAINIWVGIGMLVLGALFVVWDRLAPVPEEDIVRSRVAEEREQAQGEGDLDA